MGKGKRIEFVERKLNIKKVILAIIILLIIVIGVVIGINKDKILATLKKQDIENSQEQQTEQIPKEKTIEDILAEFGGEVIEQPKTDTYIVSKDGKIYTIYADGDIIEEKISFWNGKSSKPKEDKEGNIDIHTPEELKWVADQVINGEENFAGVTITLKNNLDFGARIKEDGNWEGPIWTSIIGFLDELQKDKEEKKSDSEEVTEKQGENLKRFAGNFNGNGFSIRGIYIESDKNYQGLFGYSTGTIENVTLKNSYISGNTGTGAIVGLNGGIVKNCMTQNTIVSGKEDKVGGIVGISMTGSNIIQSHTKEGNITGKKYIGGIAGYINNNTTITECSNSSNITGEDYTGGITGIVFYGTTIQLSDNSGKISGKSYTGGIAGFSQAQLEKVYNTGEVEGEDFVGGLVGANFTMGDISKSYNTGNIIGNNNVGGIVGTNNATTSNVYNKGNVKAEGYRAGGICGQNATESFIYNTYNIGEVEGNENIGGVVGGDFGTTTNSYYLNTLLENLESDQSKTEEELKSTILESLGEEFLADTNQKNNGYPILAWQI